MKRGIAVLLAACLWAPPALAGPLARLADLAWLTGQWEGEGIGGGAAVEVYSPAAGGQLPGHFRQLNADGSVMFYELVTIAEREGSLVYRLRHFNPDLTAWEEKGEVREFPLTAVSPGRWTFSGLTYQRTGRDRMIASVVVHGTDGKEETLVFRYRRKRG